VAAAPAAGVGVAAAARASTHPRGGAGGQVGGERGRVARDRHLDGVARGFLGGDGGAAATGEGEGE
jgi:hypothetical protein